MVSTNVNSYLKITLLLIFLYLFVNNPILEVTYGIGTIKLLYPISIYYLIINRKIFIDSFKLFKNEIFIFFFLLLFTILRSAFGGDETFVRIIGVAFFENIILSFFLMIFIIKLKNVNWLNSILKVGVIGSIISFVALINAPFNFFIKGIQILGDFSTDILFRSFGLADGLTFTYGISQGIILSLLILNSKNRLKYFLFSPLFIISCLFNARTGILIVAAVLLYEIFTNRRGKLLLFLSIIGIATFIFSELLFNYIDNDKGKDWAKDFFLQVGDVFTGSSNADFSTTDVLFRTANVMPETTSEWLVGSGESIYRSNTKHTDIGFFLQLNYGGLVFTVLLYSIIFLMFFKTYKHKDLRWFSILLLISFILANTKGDFIPNTGAFKLLFFVYINIIYYKNKSIINVKREYIL